MCPCLEEDKKNGIRHGVYPGEKPPPSVEPLENNLGNECMNYFVCGD